MELKDITYRNSVKKVLRTIRAQSITTQKKISFETKLAPMTVNNIVRELNEQGIIREVSHETNLTNHSSGRKAMWFSINPHFCYAIGVQMKISSMQMILYNLMLEEIEKSTVDIDFYNMPCVEGISKMASSLAEFIEKASIAKGKILGIGIGIPGTVDHNKGLIYEIPKLVNWKDCRLKNKLENELNVHVSIDNDIKTPVMALIWNNKVNGNIAYVHIKECVGAGIALGGKIFRGNKGAAGEIGHITVEPNGKQCNCGNNGCLELYVTDEAILDDIRQNATLPSDKLLFELCDGDLKRLNIYKAIEAVHQNNGTAMRAFENALNYIIIGIDIVCKTYAPNEVIIDNTWLQLIDKYYYHIIENLHKNNKFFRRSDVNYSFCDMENACSAGAAVLILKSLFE